MGPEDKQKNQPGSADDEESDRTPDANLRMVIFSVLLIVVILIGADLAASRVVTGRWGLEGQALFNRKSDVGALAWVLAVVVAGVGIVLTTVVRVLRSAWLHRDAGNAVVQERFSRTGRRPADGHGRTGAGPLRRP